MGDKITKVDDQLTQLQWVCGPIQYLGVDNGVIVEVTPSTPLNTIVAMRIAYFFNAFVIPNKLGDITGPDGGFRLFARQVRQPDVAFISKQRVPEIPGTFELAPDIAVEVVSPDEDIFKKTQEYLSAGTHRVWAAYAVDKMVYVFRLEPDGSVRSVAYGVDDTLDGGEVLPGFKLPVLPGLGVPVPKAADGLPSAR